MARRPRLLQPLKRKFRERPLLGKEAIAAAYRSSAQWKALSSDMRQRYFWCYDPLWLHQERPVWSQSVHHKADAVARPDLIFEESNLVCLCTNCHMHLDGLSADNLLKLKLEHDLFNMTNDERLEFQLNFVAGKLVPSAKVDQLGPWLSKL